ncbi:hypothetical protein GCM10023084_23410 [Streptomyces lacrimifluminis]|uniref:Uncharacterized protein n=1 Tax=Streptomyces lacrimifluminis TaxID=1500077 RepID=A0A917P3E1_9ACTN|nr:hypothetical protein GCM10012282_57080 [Streptomyces lacrimifluminis]
MVGAGGILGAVLKAGGGARAVSGTYGDVGAYGDIGTSDDVGAPVLVLAHPVPGVLRVTQGSAAVALVTRAGIVAPLLSAGDHAQAFTALGTVISQLSPAPAVP